MNILIDLIHKFDVNNLNLLIFNNENVLIEDIEEISKILKNIYIVLDNKFSYTKYFIKLRPLKNVHIINSNRIPDIDYDIFYVLKYGFNENVILNSIKKSLKYIFIEYNNKLTNINGFNYILPNVFQKNDLNNENQVDDQNFIRGQNFIDTQNFNDNKINNQQHIIKTNNQINFNTNNQQKIIKANNQINFNTNKLINNIKPIFNNIVPLIVDYSSNNFLKEIEFGRLDILCIISNEDDIKFFKSFVKRNGYEFVKYFIMFNSFNDNGILIKYLKSKKYSFNLFKFEETYDKELLFKIFDLLSNGEYKYDMKKYNFELGGINEN